MKTWLSMFCLFFVFFVIAPVQSFALIPPLGQDELVANSDIIVEAQVLGVVLITDQIKGSWRYRCYRAWLLVKKSQKKSLATLEIAWAHKKWIGKGFGPIGGTFEPAYYPGEEVKAYLKYNRQESAYVTVHWNGKKTLKKGTKSLPNKVGHVLLLGK